MRFNKYKLMDRALRAILPAVGRIKPGRARPCPALALPAAPLFETPPLPRAELDLTLIVPVYNSEQHLARCLSSLERQDTRYQYEVILVNDGSTDGSGKILAEFAGRNPVFRVIAQTNQGISAARNTGIRHARGRFIGFVDNDDFVTPDYCTRLLDLACENQADIVKCGHVRYDILGDKPVARVTHPSVCIRGEMGDAVTAYKGFIWGGIYAREMFSDIRFPVGFWYEDMVGRLLLMRKCRTFVFEQEPLYQYALHLDNASKKVWRKDSQKALDQLHLARLLAAYGETIGLGRGNGLYKALLMELGPVLWMRTRGMEPGLKRAAFEEAAAFLAGYEAAAPNNVYEAYLEKAFAGRNYLLWRAVSLACMSHVKAENDGAR